MKQPNYKRHQGVLVRTGNKDARDALIKCLDVYGVAAGSADKVTGQNRRNVNKPGPVSVTAIVAKCFAEGTKPAS